MGGKPRGPRLFDVAQIHSVRYGEQGVVYRTHIVRLKEDDTRFKLKAGDLLLVHKYAYDEGKYTVVCRLSDHFDPECNVYRNQVEYVCRSGRRTKDLDAG